MGDPQKAGTGTARSSLRAALDRQGGHLSTAAREAAAAFAERSGWGPGDLHQALRLADAFEVFGARAQRREATGMAVRSTPAGRVERQAVLGRYGPAVARFRSRVFGVVEAPFDRPADALGWLRSLFERQESAVDADTLEVGGRGRPAGVSVAAWRQASLEADALPLRWGTIPVTHVWARRGAYPLWPLARLCHRIAGVLHVEAGQMVRYVLDGTFPDFPPAEVWPVVTRDDTGGGEAIAAPRVEVTVFTPELTRDDLRELQRAVRAAWPTVDEASDAALEALERGTRRPTVTAADAELSEVVLDLGGEPRHGRRGAFWGYVAEAWAARGNAPVAPDSLRRRWRRLQAKRPPEAQAPKGRKRQKKARA